MRKIHVLLLLGVEAVLLCAGVAVASRNSSGTMSAINGPYVAGTVISAATINARFADIETELTDSASRSGKGGFTAPVRAADGAVAAPAFSWTSETGSGLFRNGSSDVRMSVSGTTRQAWSSTGSSVTGTFAVSSTTALSDTLSVAKSGTAAANAATFFEASLANGNSLALRLGKADTGASDGVGIYYTANATAANSKGCVAVSGQTDTLCVDGNGKVIIGSTGTGVSASIGGSNTTGGGLLASGACSATTITTTGSASGAPCAHGAITAVGAGPYSTLCDTSTAGQCIIRTCNNSGGNITFPANTLYCRVFNP